MYSLRFEIANDTIGPTVSKDNERTYGANWLMLSNIVLEF
jgi:hypothetical protein